jgi:hypothetical protein
MKITPESIRRFAETHGVSESAVAHLVEHDATFREMWNELEQSREMAQRWRKTLPQHLDRIDEFSTLARDLETEIGRYLEQHHDADATG